MHVKSESIIRDPVLSCYYVYSGAQTQVFSFGSKHLCKLRCLKAPLDLLDPQLHILLQREEPLWLSVPSRHDEAKLLGFQDKCLNLTNHS